MYSNYVLVMMYSSDYVQRCCFCIAIDVHLFMYATIRLYRESLVQSIHRNKRSLRHALLCCGFERGIAWTRHSAATFAKRSSLRLVRQPARDGTLALDQNPRRVQEHRQ